MRTPGILLAVLTVFSAGLGLTLALWRGSKPILALELFGLAWLLGAGVVSALLAVAGIFLTGSALFTVVTASALGLGWFGIRRLRTGVGIESGWADADAWEKWLTALALLPILYFGWASSREAMTWDGLLIWEAKARHAFLAGGSLPAAYFSDATRLGFHPTYPLYLSFTELWVYLWVGDCDQTALKTLFPIFYAAAIALLWSSTRRLGGSPWVAAMTAVLPLFVPMMTDHGFGLAHGYADFLLGTVYLAAVGALLAWRFRGATAGWPVAAACAALLPWIKQEGVFLVASLLVQCFLMIESWHDGRAWRRLLLFAIPAALTFSVWHIALHFFHIIPVDDFQPLTWGNLLANLPRLGPILYLMGAQLALLENWSLLWYGVPIALACLAWPRDRRRETLCLALALLVPLSLDIIPYYFTRLDFITHVATSLDRLVLQLTPVAVLALGLGLAGRKQA